MDTTVHSPENDSFPVTWSDTFLLGFPPLDDIHREFVDALNGLQLAQDETLPARLDDFAAHAQRHFDQEDTWMVAADFPPRDCHIAEHAAVMASVSQVQALLAEGGVAEARRLAQALADWFPRHADHLDSALSHWMCKLRWNAKPVVVRRGLALHL